MNRAINTNKVSFLTAIGAIALSATPAFGETNTASQVSFSCQSDNGVPTTVLKTDNNQQIIFNWQSEYLPQETDRNPLSLCNDVTAKLNNYSENENNDLSALTFKADTQGGLPAICATDEPEACNTKLFTLSPNQRPDESAIAIANNVLDDILNKELQTVTEVQNKRGLQSVSHSINIWDLILGRKITKHL